VRRAEAFFASRRAAAGPQDDAGDIPSAELLEDRVQQALALLSDVRGLWQGWQPVWPARRARTPLSQLQDHSLRASWKTQLRASRCSSIFAGAAFEPMLGECRRIHQRGARGRVWVALHMHAGDGNVHTNIPVNSDDYDMLQQAHARWAASWRWRAAWAA
jgi:FAD/FMN-containing dehydrogenase